MYLYRELLARAATDKPVRVGLVGAGKFGSMFLSQVPTTPGLVVDTIVDLDPCLLYTSPSPRDGLLSRMPSSA